MKTKIKICGLTAPKEARWLIREKVDYAGMVLFFEKSKRNNTPANAFQILREFIASGSDETGFRTKTVAVCVSPTLEQAKMIEKMGFDFLQIHGSIREEILTECKIPLIRALNSLGEMEELQKLLDMHDDRVYGILLDASEPGSGKTFDWGKVREYEFLRSCGKEFFLAGGLHASNVAEAIQTVAPDVVDVSSGVEFSKEMIGKDKDKIKEFVRIVRSLET